MDIRTKLFASHHGLVRTSELIAIGYEQEFIRIARNYGRIVAVRRGWWALPGTPPIILRAWRSGGRLACVSALAYHGEILDPGEPIHVEIPANSKGARDPTVIVHWREHQDDGDRRAVSLAVATRQARTCRAANGTL